MTDPDFDQMVRELAQAQQDFDDLERIAAPILMKLKLARNRVKALDEKLREEVRAYFAETGDIEPHGAIKMKQLPKLEINEDATFAEAVRRGASSYLQLSTSKIRTAIKEGAINWAVYEEGKEWTPFVKESLGEYLIIPTLEIASNDTSTTVDW